VAASALLDRRLLIDPEMTTAEDSYLILALLSKSHARFTFRATAVLYESEDRSQFELDPKRADDILAYHLRLLGCYSQPPQITDAHHVLRRLNERIVSPTIHDVEEREDVIIYHAKDSVLSRTPRELLFPIPFVLDAASLTLAANSSVVDDARAAMSITLPREPWAYAVQFGLAFAAVPNTPYLVEIDCRVTQGTVGIGILNEKENDFIYRLAVPTFTKSLRVHLPIEDADAVGRFVIQSWDSGGEAHIDITGITLLSDEKQPDSVTGRAIRRRRSTKSQMGFGGRYNSAGDWRAAVERIRRLAGWRPGPARPR
jgi:hypothetical protein